MKLNLDKKEKNFWAKNKIDLSYKLKCHICVFRMEFENQSLFINDRNVTGRRCFSCRFLDNSAKIWKSTGCYVEEVNVTGLTCKCNHTTNFAAFMSPFEADFNMTKSQERVSDSRPMLKIWFVVSHHMGVDIY